ncbi:MAG: putative signal-transduction protein with domain [Deltaproteobacteria bacterium]|nr:putative signal-transduction protein with domain [Deltaproteobacteria bacterium]
MHSLEQVLRNRKLLTAHPDDLVLDVIQRMTAASVGAVSVLADNRLVGVFSERDLMTRVVVAGRTAESTRIGEVMTREVVTADLDESRDECLAKMQRAGCRHLPVLAHGHVIAMVSIRDLLWDEIEEQVEEIRQLRAYVWQTPPA